MDLAEVTADDFSGAVGDTFMLRAADLSLPLELKAASTYPQGSPARDEQGRRNPFELIFRGPPDPIVTQRIYHLEHDTIGALEVFMVPIGVDGDGASYHVVFA